MTRPSPADRDPPETPGRRGATIYGMFLVLLAYAASDKRARQDARSERMDPKEIMARINDQLRKGPTA